MQRDGLEILLSQCDMSNLIGIKKGSMLWKNIGTKMIALLNFTTFKNDNVSEFEAE